MARVILFLEERSVAEVLARTLITRGHVVEIGETGAAGMGKAAGTSFDLAIVEAIGAGVNAEAEVARMRSHSPRTKVLVIGDETLPFSHLPLPLIAHRVGAAATLVWPFHPQELLAAVDQAVGTRQRRESAGAPAGKRTRRKSSARVAVTPVKARR